MKIKILLLSLLVLSVAHAKDTKPAPRDLPGLGAGGAQDMINQKKIVIPPPDRGKFPLTQTCSDPKEGTLKPGDLGYGTCMDRKNGVEAEKNKTQSSGKKSD